MHQNAIYNAMQVHTVLSAFPQFFSTVGFLF